MLWMVLRTDTAARVARRPLVRINASHSESAVLELRGKGIELVLMQVSYDRRWYHIAIKLH